MDRNVSILAMAGAVLMAAGTAAAQPVISSLSKSEQARSGRVVIRGTGFWGRDAGGYVEIGGLRAITARWTPELITAYVPEGVAPGAASVRVVAPDGQPSEPVMLEVTERLNPEGPIAWLFEPDGGGVRQRGVVGPDGTVYFSDTLGYVYAVARDGELRWIYCADCEQGTGGEGPVARGADGTLYVGGNPLGAATNIHAVRPDGTQKWMYLGTFTTLVSGPSVGPDGNVYFVHENAGTGLTALAPENGQIVWAVHPPDQRFLEFGEFGAEVMFGPSVAGGEIDRVYTMFDMRPLQPGIPNGAAGTVFSHDLSGNLQWGRYTGGQSIAGGQLQGQPAVGLDGTVYHVSLLPPLAWALYANRPEDGTQRWSLYLPPGNTMSEPSVAPDGTMLVVRNTIHIHSVHPSGTVRWTFTESGASLAKGPIASPNGEVIIAGGSRGDTETFSGYVRAISGTGTALWSAFVPRESNGSGGTVGFVTTTRAFFSPDSSRAYVGMSMAGETPNSHGYVVSLETGEPKPECAADFNADGEVTSQDFFDFLGAFFASAPAADVNADGTVTSQDFFDFLSAFFVGC